MSARVLSILVFIFTVMSFAVCEANSSYFPPGKDEAIKRFDSKLAKLIGECACTLEPGAATADTRPIGKVNVLDFQGVETPVTVVNEEYALRLFQEMTIQKKIPFGFPEDGCFARAHEMSFQLTRKNIATGKVFAKGEFFVENGKAKKGMASWSFHVAPFLVVNSGASLKIVVIDPSLFYEPVTLKAWLEALTIHSKAKLKDVYLTNRYVYHPSRRDQRLSDFDPDDLRKAHLLMKRYRKAEKNHTRKTSPDL